MPTKVKRTDLGTSEDFRALCCVPIPLKLVILRKHAIYSKLSKLLPSLSKSQ